MIIPNKNMLQPCANSDFDVAEGFYLEISC